MHRVQLCIGLDLVVTTTERLRSCWTLANALALQCELSHGMLSPTKLQHFNSNCISDGVLRGVAFDWVTGNLYLVSSDGFVLVCNGSLDRAFNCATVINGQGDLIGIVLNPGEGYNNFAVLQLTKMYPSFFSFLVQCIGPRLFLLKILLPSPNVGWTDPVPLWLSRISEILLAS